MIRSILRFFGFCSVDAHVKRVVAASDSYTILFDLAKRMEEVHQVHRETADGVQLSDPVISEMHRPGPARNAKGQFVARSK